MGLNLRGLYMISFLIRLSELLVEFVVNDYSH